LRGGKEKSLSGSPKDQHDLLGTPVKGSHKLCGKGGAAREGVWEKDPPQGTGGGGGFHQEGFTLCWGGRKTFWKKTLKGGGENYPVFATRRVIRGLRGGDETPQNKKKGVFIMGT